MVVCYLGFENKDRKILMPSHKDQSLSSPANRKLTTDDCKDFLVASYPDTEKARWKRTRKYKGDCGEVLRDFTHGKTHRITLAETSSGMALTDSHVVLTMAEQAQRRDGCFYEAVGDQLIDDDAEETLRHHLGEDVDDECHEEGASFDDLSLEGSGPETDDAGNEVFSYGFHFDGRDYSLIVYPDGSWGMNSD